MIVGLNGFAGLSRTSDLLGGIYTRRMMAFQGSSAQFNRLINMRKASQFNAAMPY